MIEDNTELGTILFVAYKEVLEGIDSSHKWSACICILMEVLRAGLY